jgi:hypothetical protein
MSRSPALLHEIIEAATRFGIIISICAAAGVVIAQGIRWAVM